jgi:molybdate/tungstate transport system substrate-binding protein
MKGRARGGRRRALACATLACAVLTAAATASRATDAPAPAAGGPETPGAATPTSQRGAAETVSVLYGPSLARLVEHRLGPEFTRATGVKVVGEAQPSLREMRLTTSSGAPADVAIVTDPEAFAEKASAAQTPTYFVFAANAMVVAYRRDSPFHKALAAGKPWFEALGAGGVRLGRTDPALDPLGADAIFVLQLARLYYETGDLVQQLLRPFQIVAAGDLVPELQSGELDVALLYRSQAVEGRLSLQNLPVEINLSDPGRRGVYADAFLDVGGDRLRGAPLVVAAVPLADSPHPAAALRFVDFLSSGPARRILDEDGFVVLPDFPLRRAWGQAP